jgi:hypothetical protein
MGTQTLRVCSSFALRNIELGGSQFLRVCIRKLGGSIRGGQRKRGTDLSRAFFTPDRILNLATLRVACKLAFARLEGANPFQKQRRGGTNVPPLLYPLLDNFRTPIRDESEE